MIGFLRFIGLLNAAVWLGGSILFAAQFGPIFSSSEFKYLLGPRNYPYFSGAMAQIALTHFFRFQLWCTIIAAIHLIAEWLYLGRPRRKLLFSLLAVLFTVVLVNTTVLRPRLQQLHSTRYALNVREADREAAARAFGIWQAVSQGIIVFEIAGVMFYFWCLASPSDAPRFR